MLFCFPRDVLDGIWDLIESVSDGFPTYSCMSANENPFFLLTMVVELAVPFCAYCRCKLFFFILVSHIAFFFLPTLIYFLRRFNETEILFRNSFPFRAALMKWAKHSF